ncbi:MAG TPA: ABC transporter substrate-binding protein [Gammaproteobacteria bacterium]|nr:ABC transporter substrate-binding protein [Gammaproteobacteria bacterium]
MKKILIIFSLFAATCPAITMADLNKKELRVTLQTSVISLDPGGVQDSQSLFVSRQVNCQLVRNQGSIFVLDAAESIKYITPLRVVLKINNKAKFHDNTLITAEDVIASFNYIKESRNIFKNVFFWIKKIEIADDKTVVFSLEKHIPQFLKVLSATNFTIFKKSFLEKARKDKSFWKVPLGCGGYKVAELNNQQIKLIPVSQGLPITFDLIKANQIDASQVGNYDIITLNVIGNSKELNDFNMLEMFDPLQYFIGVNSNSKLWKNKYDRCKFLAELDTKNLFASYGKAAIEANDLLPRGTLGYSAGSDYAIEMAGLAKNAINRESNVNLKSFCLSYLTVSIQEKNKNEYLNMFKKRYSNIIVKPIEDVKEFGKTFVNKNCDVLLFALKSNYYDGYEYLTIFENNDANFSGVHDKNLDAHILKSQYIENTNDRAKEYQIISKEIRDLCIIRPLFTIPTRRVYVRKNLKTPGIGLISIHQYYLGGISR